MLTVHAVFRGAPLCKFSKELPQRPVPGVTFVSAEAALSDPKTRRKIVCDGCEAEIKRILEKARQ